MFPEIGVGEIASLVLGILLFSLIISKKYELRKGGQFPCLSYVKFACFAQKLATLNSNYGLLVESFLSSWQYSSYIFCPGSVP
jgi:hypothetical protein